MELCDNGWSQTWMRDHLWGKSTDWGGLFQWQAKIIMEPFEPSVRDKITKQEMAPVLDSELDRSVCHAFEARKRY